MFTWNSVLIASIAAAALAQTPDLPLDPQGSFKVNLPADGPLALASADWGQSRATVRGGAVLVDLRSTLALRNSGQKRLRGVSLLVAAQEVTPGGKASVTIPSLDVAPGETFPVRIDLRLMRPLGAGSGALVQVSIDGVLFDDLSFYGPDRLRSHRTMLVWEMEARRDRRALMALLESGGPEAVQKQLLAALARQASQPRFEMQWARAGSATNIQPERSVELAFVSLPDAPVDLLSGDVQVAGNEARMPRIELQSKAKRPIRYVELGWLVRDREGKEFLAGSLASELALSPGGRASVRKENSLRFLGANGAPAPVTGLAAYLSAVEYADGEMWVPSRSSLADPRLAATLPASGEELRLAEVYRRKGIDAVVKEIRSLR